MAARLFTKKFEWKEGEKVTYYCCRGCYNDHNGEISKMTHLTRHDATYGATFSRTLDEKPGLLFAKVHNVMIGGPHPKFHEGELCEVADLYCDGCLRLIGWRFERIYKREHGFKLGLYLLDRTKIDYWTNDVRKEPRLFGREYVSQ